MINIKNLKFKVPYIYFSIIFITSLYVVYNSINIDKFIKWFIDGDSINYIGLGAFFIIGLSLSISFFLLVFSHRWVIKPAAIIFIILSAICSYFISKYNVAIDRTMLMNALYTDTGEVTGLLSFQMIPYIIFFVLLPISIVTRIEIVFDKPVKYLVKSAIFIFLILMLGVGLLYSNYRSIHTAGNQSNKYIIYQLIPVNYISSIISVLQNKVEDYARKYKKPVKITGKVMEKDDLVVVIAIGESSRQKNFSLYGYKRNTNPKLSKIKNLHILNGHARLGSTLYALREILEKSNIKLPAITSKLGVDTACYVNYTLYDNCDPIEEIEVNNCEYGEKCYDEDVVPLMTENLASYVSGQRLIVLHLGGGSHGPLYKDRYPEKFQKFNPQCLDADVVNKCTVEQLYNSFDNTILYVDFVLEKIISELISSKVPYIFIYLSDHGESLLEDGYIFHGMPPGVELPPEQSEIPLIIHSSIPIEIVKKDRYKQPYIFDTVLDLFSIENDILNKDNVFIKKIKSNPAQNK